MNDPFFVFSSREPTVLQLKEQEWQSKLSDVCASHRHQLVYGTLYLNGERHSKKTPVRR